MPLLLSAVWRWGGLAPFDGRGALRVDMVSPATPGPSKEHRAIWLQTAVAEQAASCQPPTDGHYRRANKHGPHSELSGLRADWRSEQAQAAGPGAGLALVQRRF